jgi:hypothetical protein
VRRESWEEEMREGEESVMRQLLFHRTTKIHLFAFVLSNPTAILKPPFHCGLALHSNIILSSLLCAQWPYHYLPLIIKP